MSSASERDLALLQGTWVQVGLETDGIPNAADSESPGGVFTVFVGREFFARAADGTLILAGTFTLDATASPRSITWVDSMGPDEGKALPAIYVLDGDAFKFIAGNEDEPRPTTFATVVGQTMRTFRRT